MQPLALVPQPLALIPQPLALVVSLLALVAACASGAPPNPEPAAEPGQTVQREPGYELRRISLQGGFLRVELKIPDSPPGPKPAIVVPLADEAQLLARGFVLVDFHHDWTVVPGLEDAAQREEPVSGQKVGRWLLAAPRPGIVGRAYFQLVTLSARSSVPAVVDALEATPEVDARRIGIGGSSTAGFVALEALAAEPRLAAGVVRSTCGDYHAFLRSSYLALNDDPQWLPGGQLVLDDAYAAELIENEPIRRADRFPPRPLLMLNGTADPIVPFRCAERTATRLHGAYQRAGVGERFRFVAHEGAGHDLGDEARERALRFWEQWLLGER